MPAHAPRRGVDAQDLAARGRAVGAARDEDPAADGRDRRVAQRVRQRRDRRGRGCPGGTRAPSAAASWSCSRRSRRSVATDRHRVASDIAAGRWPTTRVPPPAGVTPRSCRRARRGAAAEDVDPAAEGRRADVVRGAAAARPSRRGAPGATRTMLVTEESARRGRRRRARGRRPPRGPGAARARGGCGAPRRAGPRIGGRGVWPRGGGRGAGGGGGCGRARPAAARDEHGQRPGGDRGRPHRSATVVSPASPIAARIAGSAATVVRHDPGAE